MASPVSNRKPIASAQFHPRCRSRRCWGAKMGELSEHMAASRMPAAHRSSTRGRDRRPCAHPRHSLSEIRWARLREMGSPQPVEGDQVAALMKAVSLWTD